jgi:hypothetical protein
MNTIEKYKLTTTIKTIAEEHITKQSIESYFSSEVLEKVKERIKNRIVYYDELFKDNLRAKELAATFTNEEISELAHYEKYRLANYKENKYKHISEQKFGWANYEKDKYKHPAKQDLKFVRFFNKRERIIRNFNGSNDLYIQDKINNPNKYTLNSSNKKKIIKDWAKHFPEMVMFFKNSTYLYKRVGPLILGIHLVVKSFDLESYTVVPFIDHLLKPKEGALFGGGITSEELEDIELVEHNEGLYLDVIDITKNFFWLPTEGEM